MVPANTFSQWYPVDLPIRGATVRKSFPTPNAFGVDDLLNANPKAASKAFRTTLGWRPQSRWD
jgi:hypothetical protein